MDTEKNLLCEREKMEQQRSFKDFHVYVINLPKQLQRRHSICSSLERAGIRSGVGPGNYEVSNGVYGNEALKDENVKKQLFPGVFEMIQTGKRATHADHGVGSLGCYIAHMIVWDKILKYEHNVHNNKNFIHVVLEDDVVAPIDLKGSLFRLVYAIENGNGSVIPDDWDIINIGNRNVRWGGEKTTQVYKPLPRPESMIERNTTYFPYEVYKPTFYTGMNAYVVKTESVKRILPFMTPIRFQIDWQIGHTSLFIHHYAINPFVVNLGPYFKDPYMTHSLPVGAKSMERLLLKNGSLSYSDVKKLLNSPYSPPSVPIVYGSLVKWSSESTTNSIIVTVSVVLSVFFGLLILFSIAVLVKHIVSSKQRGKTKLFQ